MLREYWPHSPSKLGHYYVSQTNQIHPLGIRQAVVGRGNQAFDVDQYQHAILIIRWG